MAYIDVGFVPISGNTGFFTKGNIMDNQQTSLFTPKVIRIAIIAIFLFNFASPCFADSCPADMLAYWKLDETSAGPVVDYLGVNDGTNNVATIDQTGPPTISS